MADCSKYYSSNFQDKAQTAVGIIFIIYSSVIIVVNILLIVSMIATKQNLKKSSNLLIACLSIADSFTGAIMMPFLGVESIWYDSPWICLLGTISKCLQVFFSGVSMNITLLLALDRYVHMDPEFHRSPSRLVIQTT